MENERQGLPLGISIQDLVGPEFQEGRSLALLHVHFVRAAGPFFSLFFLLERVTGLMACHF